MSLGRSGVQSGGEFRGVSGFDATGSGTPEPTASVLSVPAVSATPEPTELGASVLRLRPPLSLRMQAFSARRRVHRTRRSHA
jgi:hypothetical protein